MFVFRRMPHGGRCNAIKQSYSLHIKVNNSVHAMLLGGARSVSADSQSKWNVGHWQHKNDVSPKSRWSVAQWKEAKSAPSTVVRAIVSHESKGHDVSEATRWSTMMWFSVERSEIRWGTGVWQTKPGKQFIQSSNYSQNDAAICLPGPEEPDELQWSTKQWRQTHDVEHAQWSTRHWHSTSPQILSEPSGTTISIDEMQVLLKTIVSWTNRSRAGIVVTAGSNGQILHANRAWEMLCGYQLAEVVGQTNQVLQGKGTDLSAAHLLMKRLRGGQPAQATLYNYKKGQIGFWNSISVYPILDGEISRSQIQQPSLYAAFVEEVEGPSTSSWGSIPSMVDETVQGISPKGRFLRI